MNSFWNGRRRFIALLMFLAGVFVALRVPPVIPVIQLPGEQYPAGAEIPILGLRLTNSFMGSVIVWIILLLLAVYVSRRRPKSGDETPPGGFYNMFEAAFEGLMSFVSNIAGGEHFRLIFNVFMTIFLIVLMSNWLELIPGVDSVGLIEPHVAEVYNADTGEYELETESGYEIYKSVVGYAVNGQCNWISAEDEALADEAALAQAEIRADEVRAQLAQEAALARFETGHGESADHEAEATAEAHSDEETEDVEHAVESGTGVDPEEAAEEAYQAVLAGRVADKKARADRGCYTGVGLAPWLADEGGSDDHGDDAGEEHADEEHGIPSHPAPSSEEAKLVPWVVLPFVRVPSTDLNMTLSIALVAFVMIQFIGFRALGIGYLTKFFNFRTLFTSPLGGIDVAVGLLELIGDFAKILSFSFRLLGNIFAGSILLFVMSFLVPILPWPFFILEFFVGIIQALVFALLTAIFMNLATASHGHDEHHDEEHASEH